MKKGRKTWIVIGVIVAVLLITGAVAWVFVRKKKQEAAAGDPCAGYPKTYRNAADTATIKEECINGQIRKTVIPDQQVNRNTPLQPVKNTGTIPVQPNPNIQL